LEIIKGDSFVICLGVRNLESRLLDYCWFTARRWVQPLQCRSETDEQTYCVRNGHRLIVRRASKIVTDIVVQVVV